MCRLLINVLSPLVTHIGHPLRFLIIISLSTRCRCRLSPSIARSLIRWLYLFRRFLSRSLAQNFRSVNKELPPYRPHSSSLPEPQSASSSEPTGTKSIPALTLSVPAAASRWWLRSRTSPKVRSRASREASS